MAVYSGVPLSEPETIPYLPFTKEELKKAVAENHVSVRRHPIDDLYIFNYTPLVQYNRHWDAVTKTSRGLILDDDYNIVARPFQKIFNYTEIVPDPVIFKQPPVITDKLDGSLGILYRDHAGKWCISTRGSFESEQAMWATEWFNKNFPTYDQPDNVTLLFEIVYPENRICVNYGQRAELILIAAINNITGSDIPLKAIGWWHGEIVEQILGPSDIDDAYKFATSNEYEDKEGVVCTWFKYNEPSFRLKIKHPEYVRLHGIMYNFSAKKVWQTLADGKDFLDLLVNVPDEFYTMVKDMIADFKAQYQAIEDKAWREYDVIKHITNRKSFAEEAKQMSYPPILFRMLDDKDYSDIIWKICKPKEQDEN